MPLVFGLTGLPCCGKSTAARYMAELGGVVIDVDRVGHAVLERPEIRLRLKERFGEKVVPADSAVDRRRLGQIVFADAQALLDLERLVHPAMTEVVQTEVSAANKPVVIDAALLMRMGLHQFCDKILLVEATPAVREVCRTARGWSDEQLRLRESNLLNEMKRVRELHPRIVMNDGTLEQLQERVLLIWKETHDAHQEKAAPEARSAQEDGSGRTY